MADIAFLLIIFFMVTSVFAATKGLEMSLPTDEPPAADRPPEEAIFIHVRPDGVLVDCRPMRTDEIRAYIDPVLARNPNKPVILYTESEAAYRDMVQVYDVLVDGHRPPNIFLPTRSDIEAYAAMFGENPLATACR